MANRDYQITYEDQIGGKWRKASSLSVGENARSAIKSWKRGRPWAKEVKRITAKRLRTYHGRIVH